MQTNFSQKICLKQGLTVAAHLLSFLSSYRNATFHSLLLWFYFMLTSNETFERSKNICSIQLEKNNKYESVNFKIVQLSFFHWWVFHSCLELNPNKIIYGGGSNGNPGIKSSLSFFVQIVRKEVEKIRLNLKSMKMRLF